MTSERVDHVAVEVAEAICPNGPQAVRLTRRITAVSESLDDDAAWAMLDQAAREVRDSPDLQEGLRSFAEKRPPRWIGR